MGWDAFGLPAENYAIKTGIHPKITTERNIANIKRQMQMTGLEVSIRLLNRWTSFNIWFDSSPLGEEKYSTRLLVRGRLGKRPFVKEWPPSSSSANPNTKPTL